MAQTCMQAGLQSFEHHSSAVARFWGAVSTYEATFTSLYCYLYLFAVPQCHGASWLRRNPLAWVHLTRG